MNQVDLLARFGAVPVQAGSAKAGSGSGCNQCVFRIALRRAKALMTTRHIASTGNTSSKTL